MPIHPDNKARYPKEWAAISQRIRFERAQGRCECDGECGNTDARGHVIAIHRDGEPRCSRRHGDPIEVYAEEFGAWVDSSRSTVLTVAHLDHRPEHCDDANLKAMCQACHLAYDAKHHAQSRRERSNRDQLNLLTGPRERSAWSL